MFICELRKELEKWPATKGVVLWTILGHSEEAGPDFMFGFRSTTEHRFYSRTFPENQDAYLKFAEMAGRVKPAASKDGDRVRELVRLMDLDPNDCPLSTLLKSIRRIKEFSQVA